MFWEKGVDPTTGKEWEVVWAVVLDMGSDCQFLGIKEEPFPNLTPPCYMRKGKRKRRVEWREPGLGLAWQLQVLEHKCGEFGVEPNDRMGAGVGMWKASDSAGKL